MEPLTIDDARGDDADSVSATADQPPPHPVSATSSGRRRSARIGASSSSHSLSGRTSLSPVTRRRPAPPLTNGLQRQPSSSSLLTSQSADHTPLSNLSSLPSSVMDAAQLADRRATQRLLEENRAKDQRILELELALAKANCTNALQAHEVTEARKQAHNKPAARQKSRIDMNELLTPPEQQERTMRDVEARRAKALEDAQLKAAKESAARHRERERARNAETKVYAGQLSSYKKDELKDLAFAIDVDHIGKTVKDLTTLILAKFEENPALKEDHRFSGLFMRTRRKKKAQGEEEGEQVVETQPNQPIAGPSNFHEWVIDPSLL